MSLLDKATTGASCWEALKVDFALETLDKKHLYVIRMMFGHGAAGQRGRRVETDPSKTTSDEKMFFDDLK